jgi:hypothetical protein
MRTHVVKRPEFAVNSAVHEDLPPGDISRDVRTGDLELVPVTDVNPFGSPNGRAFALPDLGVEVEVRGYRRRSKQGRNPMPEFESSFGHDGDKTEYGPNSPHRGP